MNNNNYEQNKIEIKIKDTLLSVGSVKRKTGLQFLEDIISALQNK